ncbi:MAG: coenzyme F420-0:L-glutamate ligase [Candidatus Bathyarchaeota archaeon]
MGIKFRFKVKRIKTKYWRIHTDYLQEIVDSISKIIKEGDMLVVSEKAISVAQGNIVDESIITPGASASFLAKFWMRVLWGYLFGVSCRLKRQTIERIRNYPVNLGARHKQLALIKVGFLQALRFGSEGGIDVSNLPQSYSCLPLRDPTSEAKKIFKCILMETGKNVTVLIVDSDKTYSFRGLHLSPTRTNVEGIHCKGGFILYLLGRFFKFRPRSTPKAIFPLGTLTIEEALDLSESVHHLRGCGAGKTVWDMAEKFNVGLTKVTWAMLDSIEHYPIVILRRS